MSITDFFFTLFCVVFFCCGLSLASEKGNLLYFLSKPFEDLYERIQNRKNLAKVLLNETFKNRDDRGSDLFLQLKKDIKSNKKKLKLAQIIYNISKPIISCITCMASLWGTVVFISLNSFSLSIIGYLIITILSASFIQTFIYKLFHKI